METRIKQEVRLFEQILSLRHGESIVAGDDDPDLAVLSQWLKGGLIECNTGRDKDGVIFFVPALTPYGHSMYEHRKSELSDSTSVGVIKKFRFGVYKWILGGVVTPVIVWLILEKLKDNA